MQQKILRLPAVIERTGMAKTQIYGGMKAGTFPKSVPIGERSVGWIESEIDGWVQARIEARRAA